MTQSHQNIEHKLGTSDPSIANDRASGENGHASPNMPGMLDEPPDVDPATTRLITADDAIRLRAVPVRKENNRLLVAMFDVSDDQAADELSVVSGMPVSRLALTEPAFKELLETTYGTTAADIASRLSSPESQSEDMSANLEAIDAESLHRMAEQPTLINLVNLIILEAVRSRASDIHIEPFERELRVKYRIDGVLSEQSPPPKNLQPAITSRVKIMAGMNIAERYVPQDGHITLRFENRKIDIRVSTVPTIYGESVVMRVLDKESVTLELATLGMRESHRDTMQRLIDLPHGMVLVTGPTGSGKTTTLYAALTKLYDPSKKIITIEDPVEYELNGVNQIPVNPKRGLNFATGLRSILRQDPDVIMVGEIRDHETADIAVRSALTGHLLFSTLHTNDAVSAIGRMTDMGVEPFLLASVLEGVIAQRLGRRICQNCKEAVRIDEATLHRLNDSEKQHFPNLESFQGAGCDKCDDSGVRGRVGFYEILSINTAMRGRITNRASITEILSAADDSHTAMRYDGLLKASQGLTTIDQVLRATQDTEQLA